MARERLGERAVTVVRDVWSAVTPLGRAVGLAGVVSWVLAAWFGWAEMAMLAAGLLLSLLVGVASLLFGNVKLNVLLDLATPRVVVGDMASSTVVATNDSVRRMLPVRLEARVGRGVAQLEVPSLASGASHDEVFLIPTNRRSVVPVGPVRSVQGDPLGLVRREHLWTGTENLFVHPRTVQVPPVTTGWMRDLEGMTTNDRSPSDVAFHTLREYVVGDDRRHIHWRTTARQADGKMMVREFVDTRRAHLGLVLSLRAEDYASDEEFELAVSALASIGQRALRDEQDLTVLAGIRPLPSFHGASFMDALAGLKLGSDPTPLAGIAAQGRDHLRAVSLAVVVSGSGSDPSQVRIATQRLGPAVSSVGLTAKLGSVTGLLPAPQGAHIELGALEDLPSVLTRVTVS